MCLLDDGSLALDPTHDQVLDSVAELLFAGTRKHVIMMEATSYNLSIPEEIFSNLMRLAHGAIQPILDTQEALRALNQEEEPSDEELRTSLGLGPSSNKSDEKSLLDASGIFEEAYNFCLTRFEDASLRLFGYEPGMEETPKSKSSDIRIHPVGTHLLSKSVRGRREHILFTEIDQALRNEFEPTNEDVRKAYKDDIAMLSPILTSAIHKKILQKALYTVSSTYQTRGDNRGTTWSGDKTIRPVSVTVPALPDSVHGSCLFSRGETQVLCTTTLGAPRDGMPHTHPYEQKEESGKPREPGAYDHLPVGSLRYLRSQEALISDFNTKRIKADKEITGESGTLDEVRRFFMHYDFPSYSKGELPSGRGNRREVGHGRLAERALLSSIPAASDFPYAMRVTSEVTSSNGSSSMASVCGATIALLDAGVPLIAPVAGVSVGLALGDTPSEYHLLLDITGTEDHYGWMDFKVAGTEEGITALQLDVKRGLPMEVLVEAVDLARKGREALLDEMDVLSKHSSASIITKLLPRPALKESAPRVEVVRFDPIRKRDLVGPGGAVLRQLEDRFQVSLDLSQDGQCLLFGRDREMVSKAKSAVMDLVADVEEGQVYEGTVIELKDFGAILELLRNKEGLLHVSELLDDLSHPEGNYGLVHQHLRVGQKIQVLCTGVDPVQGTIRLSYKALKQRHVEEMKKRQD
jgi:polyribonucleotide nucleotidyltransferase